MLLSHFSWLLLGFGLTLSGCSFDHGIKNDQLRERVLACGAGFSDELMANIDASYATHSFEGKLNNTFKDQTRVLIFSEIPEQDRLKAYEDYIKCIEFRVFPIEKLPLNKKYAP